jgi:hypothetical protein
MNKGKRQEKDCSFNTLRSNGYPNIFLDEVEKRQTRETEFVPSSDELVRTFSEYFWMKLRETDKGTEFVPSPKERVRTFSANVELENNSSYAVFPYINGPRELLKRLLKRYGIRTTTKPHS